MPIAETELAWLERQRVQLLHEQFTHALGFYAIKGDDTISRVAHRRVSQLMAYDAVDLALPHVVKNMQERGLHRIALVAPLRGGLALVTPSTAAFLKGRLTLLKAPYEIELWAQGIKRYPAQDRADIYFASDYTRRDNHSVYAIIFDWGTATGLTNDYGAKDLKSHGVDFGRMTSLSMTLAPKGKQRLLTNCIDGDGSRIHIEAATHAHLNQHDYVDQIAPAYGGQYRPIIPKDWGAKMWGMENPNDPPLAIVNQIDVFMDAFARTF